MSLSVSLPTSLATSVSVSVGCHHHHHCHYLLLSDFLFHLHCIGSVATSVTINFAGVVIVTTSVTLIVPVAAATDIIERLLTDLQNTLLVKFSCDFI